MSSLALARKYRPQGFDSVVGQETTVRILKNALTRKRLHHAYLFTGPRGIGKTTLARIFAKALNCDRNQGPDETAEPCNECESCRDITEGRSLSVQEIDGASNTSVEDVRDLREKIRYLPPGGRYKIYIIDEVHMLSTAAFNALLKTLEEPPPHALFLFATTDPQKVPATVLSRVIRFDLKPISRGTIVQQLKKVLGAENVPAEDDALFLIAREAEGGLRDALSLLDQVISFSGSRVTLEGVEEITGVSTRGFLRELIPAFLKRDAAASLAALDKAFQAGLDVKRLALDLLENLRDLSVVRISRDPALFDLSQDEIDELAGLAGTVAPAHLDRLFRMAQKGIGDLLRSPMPRVVFDVLVMRLANAEDLLPLEDLLAALKGARTAAVPQPPSAPNAVPSAAPASPSSGEKNWRGFMAFLRGRSARLAALLEQGTVASIQASEIRMRFPSKAEMTVELLKEQDREAALTACLRDYFGKDLKLSYEPAGNASSGAGGESIVDDAISIFSPSEVKSPAKKVSS